MTRKISFSFLLILLSLATIAISTSAFAQSAAIKVPVRVATTANISGTWPPTTLPTIDGVAIAVGDRVLVKNQTTASQNGIWVAASGSSWTRAADFSAAGDAVQGTQVFVTTGQVNAGDVYSISTAGTITIGTTSINFALLAGTTQPCVTVALDPTSGTDNGPAILAAYGAVGAAGGGCINLPSGQFDIGSGGSTAALVISGYNNVAFNGAYSAGPPAVTGGTVLRAITTTSTPVVIENVAGITFNNIRFASTSQQIGGGYFTGSISGTTLTVSGSVTGTPLAVGQTLTDCTAEITPGTVQCTGNLIAGTYIVSGSGSTWTVNVNYPTPVSSETMNVVSAYMLIGNANNIFCNYCVFEGGYDSVVIQESAAVYFTNPTIRNTADKGILFTGQTNGAHDIFITSPLMDQDAPISNPNVVCGLCIYNSSGAITVIGGSILHQHNDLLISPTTGQTVIWPFFSNASFDFPDYLGEVTASGTNGSASLTGVTYVLGPAITIGMTVSDLTNPSYIPGGTTITAGSGSSWTMSANATHAFTTDTLQVTFTNGQSFKINPSGYGIVNGVQMNSVWIGSGTSTLIGGANTECDNNSFVQLHSVNSKQEAFYTDYCKNTTVIDPRFVGSGWTNPGAFGALRVGANTSSISITGGFIGAAENYSNVEAYHLQVDNGFGGMINVANLNVASTGGNLVNPVYCNAGTSTPASGSSIVNSPGSGATASNTCLNTLNLPGGLNVQGIANTNGLGVTGNIALSQVLALGGYGAGSLPTGAAGWLAYVTDQNGACPAAGVSFTPGGTTKCLAFHNGTTWVSPF